MKNKNIFEYIKKILYLANNNSRELRILILMFLTSSMLDLIGIGFIIPYISIISNSAGLVDSEVYKFINAFGFAPNIYEFVAILGLALVSIFSIKAVAYMGVNFYILRFGFNRLLEIRSQLINYYQTLPYESYIKKNSSEYVFNIHSISSHYSTQVLTSLLMVASEVIVVFFIFILLGYISFYELLLLLFLSGSMVYAYLKLFKNKLIGYGRIMNESSTKVIRGINESVGGVKEIRILGKESFFSDIVINNSKTYISASIKNTLISLAPRYIIELILVIFIVLLVSMSIFFGSDLNIILETIIIFGVASIRLIPSITQIISSIGVLHNGKNTVEILYSDIFNYRNGNIDTGILNHNYSSSDSFQSLELKNVCYQYPETSNKAINNISIVLNKGDVIGIVGRSGSGKTTVIDVLLGFLKPNSGIILYNGKSQTSSLSEWRSKVAYITQELFLIDDTVRNNIALKHNSSNVKVKDEFMDKAIQKARLHDFINQLPKGLDTELGERGIKLSGGQKQRIALARALYHEREVIIMDEATSALDNETESEVMKEIRELKGKVTMIIIAHRISTLQYCDRIYQLDPDPIYGAKEVSYDRLIT